jgi:hypothetical protein
MILSGRVSGLVNCGRIIEEIRGPRLLDLYLCDDRCGVYDIVMTWFLPGQEGRGGGGGLELVRILREIEICCTPWGQSSCLGVARGPEIANALTCMVYIDRVLMWF